MIPYDDGPPAGPSTAVDDPRQVAARERFQQGLRAVLDQRPDDGAVQLAGVWTTWRQLVAAREPVRTALAAVSDGPVALVLRNRPSGIAALLALLDSGRTIFLVSPIQPPMAIAADVERCGVVAVVADAADWSPELSGVRSACGIELADGADGSVSVTTRDRPPRTTDAVPATLPPGTAVVIPTSGTTGPPKRIPIAWDKLPVPRTARSPRVVINGLSSVTITGFMTIIRSLTSGLSLALLERLEVRAWAELVREHRPRVAGLPPAAMRMLLDSDVDPSALASIEVWPTGSAPVPPALQEEFEARFGIPVLVSYGATEFGGAVAGWSLEEHRRWATEKRGSVGTAAAGVQLRIADQETGVEVGPGTVGLLEVKSPTAPLAPGEWIRTNDLAHLDEDGFLYIHGRADDVIVRGGFKVPLGELEELLTAHPSVRAAGAVGLPDDRLGRVPAAAVTLVPGSPAVDEQELTDWIRARSAPYKVPVLIEVVDRLPETVSHKVSRPGLTELLGPLHARRSVASTGPVAVTASARTTRRDGEA